jgi:glycosyltransferase involved in cell wall biosynthesis
MRIVYVLTTLAVGGTERQVLAIARRMAARGHDVALLVLRCPEPDWLTTELTTVSLEMGRGFRSAFAGFRRGVGFLRAFRPDIVHSHNFHGNMLARMMRLIYRHAGVISTIHNVYEGGRMRMLAYRLTDGLADRTAAVSAAVAERFLRLRAVRKEKCLVLTNGIEICGFVPDAERRVAMREQMGVRDEFVWLCVARNTAAKDIPNLLQAFAKAWKSEPKIALWMAGPDSAAGAAKAMYAVSTMPLDALDGLRRLGTRSDIPALLDAADGFVLASAWEGMPLAVGEAMAMEKPVVATDVGGVRELVGEDGVLVRAKDADALAGAMVEMMRRPASERLAMGRAARERILANFGMDRKADEWEALYRSVID